MQLDAEEREAFRSWGHCYDPEGDGNCMFECASRCLRLPNSGIDEFSASQLRQKVQQQLQTSLLLRNHVLDAAAQLISRATPTPLEQGAVTRLREAGSKEEDIVTVYSNYMGSNGAFATDLELQALSLALPSTTVEIYRSALNLTTLPHTMITHKPCLLQV